jgi:hypothetical protein
MAISTASILVEMDKQKRLKFDDRAIPLYSLTVIAFFRGLVLGLSSISLPLE